MTDSKNKDKDSVFTFIHKLFENEMSNLKKKIVIFTDGPSSEFKNKYITKFVGDIKNFCARDSVMWKYFATSHGKGAVDGIGGRAKSHIRAATKSKNGCTVQSSKDFATLVTELMPGLKVIHVSDNEIKKFVDKQKPWENVKSILGILKTHCIVCEKKESVSLYTDDLKDNQIANLQYYDKIEEEDVEDHDKILKASNQDSDTVQDSPSESPIEGPTAMSRFIAFLKRKGLILNGATPSDGNCFLGAVSKALSSIDIHMSITELREKATDFLRNMSSKEKNSLKGFMTGSFRAYISHMENSGSYADHILIEATSKALKVGIKVVPITGEQRNELWGLSSGQL